MCSVRSAAARSRLSHGPGAFGVAPPAGRGRGHQPQRPWCLCTPRAREVRGGGDVAVKVSPGMRSSQAQDGCNVAVKVSSPEEDEMCGVRSATARTPLSHCHMRRSSNRAHGTTRQARRTRSSKGGRRPGCRVTRRVPLRKGVCLPRSHGMDRRGSVWGGPPFSLGVPGPRATLEVCLPIRVG